MKFEFHKYQGTGNDFVIIDDRKSVFPQADAEFIARICDRKFGIGADGLMLVRSKAGFDFEMVYFNSDGRTSSMCGNGGRCIAHYAHFVLGMASKLRFDAIDGEHEAVVGLQVELKMKDVLAVEIGDGYLFIDTGSPHYIAFVDDLTRLDLIKEARLIRYNDRFSLEGTNVNFVAQSSEISMRTYERGVEDETLSCGTGVTAVAIAMATRDASIAAQGECNILTNGGKLSVQFAISGNRYTDIWLKGAATMVYKGEISVKF